MKASHTSKIVDRIIEKAESMGADLAGTVAVSSLKVSPPHRLYPRISIYIGVGTRSSCQTRDKNRVCWPTGVQTAIVIAVLHPRKELELDWWDGGKGTPGNRVLVDISRNLEQWIKNRFGFQTWPLPYDVGKGGILLKDAAITAGIGVIGKNNLLVTTSFGSLVRLRCLLVSANLPETVPLRNDPRDSCGARCRDACPQNAFAEPVFTDRSMGSMQPGRNGAYDRILCARQMEADIETGAKTTIKAGH